MRHLANLFSSVILIAAMFGCGSRQVEEPEVKKVEVVAHRASAIISPVNGTAFTAGEKIEIIIESKRSINEIDSISFFADGEVLATGQNLMSFKWDSENSRVGSIPLRVQVFYSDGTVDLNQVVITIKSDIIPVWYTFEVINSFPHDITAFTQGLVYDAGYLYESTGQYGQSSLRKVQLETGKIVRHISLDRDLFGEGLCIFQDKLYQITWRNRVGFIYDKETMQLLTTIHYQTEGWGLTTDGKKLIMSDGSHYIFFLDPQYFTETGRIEVYDNNGPVANLNEMELIDGYLYANIFGTDKIAVFSPKTGKVSKYIDLTGILPENYRHQNIDVLNGIAHDPKNDRLFVTGKNWPLLFEIRLRAK